MAKLKVVPLSSRRLLPGRLSVDPLCAEALVDWLICSPRKEPLRFPAALVVVPTVLPTALVVVPATFPTVPVVVLTTPLTVLPTPPKRPPPLLFRGGAVERVLADDWFSKSVSTLELFAWV